MQKALLILGILILTGLVALDVHRFFTTDEGIQYYASHPQRLLWVSGITVLVGILAFAFSRLSEPSRRKVKLLALGGFAGFMSCFTGLLVTALVVSASMITKLTMWILMGASVCSVASIAALLWLEFFKVWKQRNRTII